MPSPANRDRVLSILRRQDGLASAEERAEVNAYLRAKTDLGSDMTGVPLRSGVTIVRDDFGVPHIHADDPYDLFFAHGVVQAQDRLWQIDYLRRQAHGRLAEILGANRLNDDILARTLSMTEIATAALAHSASESRDALGAFADGVNYWTEHLPAGLPIEFELLGYEPEPWQPVDSIAVLRRWYWYLTGRLPVISTPEAVRAGIGDLADAFFQPDGETAYIVPSGNYDPTPAFPDLPVAEPKASFWGQLEAVGSNNWAAAPDITKSGHAMVGSDPHVYYTVPADWFDVHLHGAGYDLIGMTYPGVPMVRFGRNREMAWGITNNICMQRDLYVEQINPDNPGEYHNGDKWVPFDERVSVISVRDEAPIAWSTRFAHGRPIVDHLIANGAMPADLWGPERGANTSLSLAWVGSEPSDEPQALLDLGRARTVAEARTALEGWRCPTWNFVLADTAGSIAYQCTGALPLRGRDIRGYRDASNPLDAWQGYIPFDGLPRLIDPERGWVASANNPTAPDNFPYPLSGTWAVEDRAARAETLLEEYQPHTEATFAAMQNDVFSGRAARGVPGLLATLTEAGESAFERVDEILRDWDFHLDVDSIGGTLFYVFFWRWHQQVVRARFAENLVPLVQDAGWGMSSALLHRNEEKWFASEADRVQAMETAMQEALEWLEDRLGPDMSVWTWGSIHRLGAIHPAAQTPLQHELFDIPLEPQPGGASTLSSAFYNPIGTFDTKIGPSYRIIAALDPDSTTRSVTWPGHSGLPGSPHYRDQVAMHKEGRYAEVRFDWDQVVAVSEHTQNLRN